MVRDNDTTFARQSYRILPFQCDFCEKSERQPKFEIANPITNPAPADF